MEELAEIERWQIVLVVVLLFVFIVYQFRKKHIKLVKRIESLLAQDNNESKDVAQAIVSLHYGKYEQALTKLKFAAIDYPERNEIKTAITELQKFIREK